MNTLNRRIVVRVEDRRFEAHRKSLRDYLSQSRRGFADSGAAARRYGRDAESGLDRSSRAARQSQRELSGVERGWRRVGTAVKGFIAGVLIRYLAQGTRAAFDTATSVSETASAFRAVFAGASEEMDAFLDGFANVAGMTRTEGRQAATNIAAIGKGVGIADEALVDFSSRVLEAAGDLQSFYNTRPGESVAALRSFLTGEMEPMKRFGVVIRELDVQRRAMADTGKTQAAALTEEEKAWARLALVTERLQAAGVLGDLNRTKNELANRTRTLTARLRDEVQVMSTGLLPSFALLADAVDLYSQNTTGASKATGFLARMIFELVAGALQLYSGIKSVVAGTFDFIRALTGADAEALAVENRIGGVTNGLAVMGDGLSRGAAAWAEFVSGVRRRLAGLAEYVAGIMEKISALLSSFSLSDKVPAPVRRFLGMEDDSLGGLGADLKRGADALREFAGEQRTASEGAAEFAARVREGIATRQREREALGALIATRRQELAQLLAEVGVLPEHAAQLLADAEAGDENAAATVRRLNAVQQLAQRIKELREEVRLLEELGPDALGALLLEESELKRRVETLREYALLLARYADTLGARASLRGPADLRSQAPLQEQIAASAERAADAFERMGEAARRKFPPIVTHSQKVREQLRAVVELADNAARLFDAMGMADLSGLARSVGDVVAAMERLEAVRAEKNASALATLGAGLGVAGAVAGGIASLVASISAHQEEQRRLQTAIIENSRAIQENTRELLEGRIGGAVTPAQAEALRAVLSDPRFADFFAGFRGAGGDFMERSLLGDVGRDFFDALTAAGFDVDDLRQAFEDAMAAGDWEAMWAVIDETNARFGGLLGGLGTYSDDLEGALAALDDLTRYLGVEGREALEAFLARLRALDLGPEFEALFSELEGLDLSTPEGQEAYRLALEHFYAQQVAGGFAGLPAGWSRDDFDRWMDAMLSIGRGGAAGASQGVAAVRNITEIQGNQLLGYQQEILRVNRLMEGHLAYMAGRGGGEAGRGGGEAGRGGFGGALHLGDVYANGPLSDEQIRQVLAALDRQLRDPATYRRGRA